MCTSNSKKILAAGLFATSLAACQSTPLPAVQEAPVVAPHRADVHFPITSLDPDSAAALVVNEQPLFQSAIVLAAQRPPVKQELANVVLRVTGSDNTKTITPVRYSALPLGLNLTFQDRAPVTETSIDVFGVATAVYLHSVMAKDYSIPVATTNQVRLLDGALFSADSDFKLELAFDGGDVLVEQCAVMDKVAAATLHQKLSGTATRLRCTATPVSMVSEIWYLEDYARYLPHVNYGDDNSVHRFSIDDLTFRAPAPAGA